jgi:alkaline phosphatase D
LAGASVDSFKFAFASCQQFTDGFYNAYADMAQQDLDLVIHVGDYIYEGGGQGSLGRGHLPAHVILTLDDYRTRHGQYRSDPDLQAAHAAFPWIVTWDDHEVTNNYSAFDSDPDTPPFGGLEGVEAFLARRANAYRVYWEMMPLRQPQFPKGPAMALFRRLSFGNMVDFHVLDTRQYRDDHAATFDEALLENRTILGAEQRQWLFDGLAASRANWNVLAQQVLFAEDGVDATTFPGDTWDGYVADRNRILGFLQERGNLNPIVITGDAHRNAAYDLKMDFFNPDSQTVGAEFMGTSICTSGDVSPDTVFSDPNDPHQRFNNRNRGYVRCEMTPQLWRTDYRIVPTVRAQGAPGSTLASFVVESGNPGIQSG